MEKVSNECSRPIKLVMSRADALTGEVSNLEYTKSCGSRLVEKCPHCSEVYRRDAISVFQGGLKDVGNATVPFTFLTFTAPGADVFGPTHQRVVDNDESGKSRIRQCGCRQVHAKDDVLIGTPLNPATYRYDLAADFNAHASRLFSVTMQRLGRVVGHKLAYARVAEFQTRGLIHYHVIVRGIVTERNAQAAVRGGTDSQILTENKAILERREAEKKRKALWKKECKKSGLKTPYQSDYKSERVRNPRINAVSHGGWTWGTQVDVQRVLPGGKFGVGAYLSKLLGYAVKGTDTSANGPDRHRRRMQGAAIRTCGCDKGWGCGGGARHFPGSDTAYQSEESARVEERRASLVRLAKSRKLCRRHQLAYNGWGFRGHVLAFSRKWGMTFKEVRNKRKTFAAVPTWLSNRYIVLGWFVMPRGSPLVI